VELEPLEPEDLERVRHMISRHVHLTASPKGRRLLDRWEDLKSRFIKVMPIDYKRILVSQRQERREIA